MIKCDIFHYNFNLLNVLVIDGLCLFSKLACFGMMTHPKIENNDSYFVIWQANSISWPLYVVCINYQANDKGVQKL